MYLLLVILSFVAGIDCYLSFVYKNRIDFKNPAFVSGLKGSDGNNALIVSRFGVSLSRKMTDGVFVISNISDALKTSKFVINQVGENLIWPNEVEVIGNKLYVPGGFLVPGKKGHISMADLSEVVSGTPVSWKKLAQNDAGFFHRVKSVPILGGNGNDTHRLLSCRGKKGVFDKGGGEMVYYNPVDKTLRTLFEGCDCYFETVDFNSDGVFEFVIPQFFGQKLMLVWTEEPNGDYTKPEFIRQRVIDADIGMAFDVDLADLNGDGIPDILATNHQGAKSAIRPGVFEYIVTLPSQVQEKSQKVLGANHISEFMNSINFEKRVVIDNFDVRSGTINAAAPGAAHVVSISTEKSVIVVSGDDNGKAYIIDKDHSKSYTMHEIHDCQGTVGGVFVDDVDGDGNKEIFIPCYSKHYIAVYTMVTVD